jgi:hypothetical protein
MIYNINGVEIATSSLGRSGYYGVTLSPAWTLDIEHPFIAMRQNPVNDPVLSKWLTAKERLSLHLGVYADAREAAYVVGLYENDPEEILKELYHNGSIEVDFPQEIYKLPVFIALDEVKKLINDFKEKKKAKKKPTKIKLQEALAAAREVLSQTKINNVTFVRKEIERKVNKKLYTSVDDVKEHVMEIAAYA